MQSTIGIMRELGFSQHNVQRHMLAFLRKRQGKVGQKAGGFVVKSSLSALSTNAGYYSTRQGLIAKR